MRRLTAAILMFILCGSACGAEQVRVVPEETDEILANPGMGWQTFHETSRSDRNLPGWIPSTVQYARWGWGRFELEAGKIDREFLEGVLKETSDAGQRLAFRVMCCSPEPGVVYHPRWLKDAGGRIVECEYEGKGPVPIPDFDDAVVLERHLDFIKRLGQTYDGHPDIDHVDIGSIGWWGEWHMSGSKCGMPSEANQRRIAEAYLGAFKKTRLLMTLHSSTSMRRAIEGGAGWRADCLGDLGMFAKDWSHMRDGYPKWIREMKVENGWRSAPAAFETCGDMRRWVKEGWSLRQIFNYGLALHASYINNKSAPLPAGPNVRAEVERFLKRLGYRLVLREIKHPQEVRRGDVMEISMRWQNVGSAPCYRQYRVAYRLSDDSGRTHVLTGGVAVDKWMPGSVALFDGAFFKSVPDLPDGEVASVTDRVEIPAGIAAGVYALSVGIVSQSGVEPIVRLGIKGRSVDGWYPLSRISVGE